MTPALSDFRLRRLPASARLTITALIAMIGAGYLISLMNIYHRHRLADGKPELTFDDILITYHGKDVPLETPQALSGGKSKMLEQVEPGGAMRKHLEKGGEPAIRSLIAWLEAGASEPGFKKPTSAHPSDPTPEQIISSHCLRCHNAAGGEKADTPYGPDIFTVEFALVREVATPPPLDPGAKPRVVTTKRVGPQSLSHLVLITHAHVLSIPLFTLTVFFLFLFSDFSSRWKGWIGPLPMIATLLDISAWWLARLHESLVHMISLTGAIFGISLAMQMFAVLYSLWRAPIRSTQDAAGA